MLRSVNEDDAAFISYFVSMLKDNPSRIYLESGSWRIMRAVRASHVI